jgi:predicted GTPase
MLVSEKPVIAVTAVRTGCGKSQTARYLSSMFQARGIRVAILRHPMPYGDLSRQQVQRFASLADLDDARCTNEEREEYEPHISMGSIVFAGVDYQEILRRAEREADLILWDGGNNDFSFVRPDLNIVMTDALRPGQSLHYHPGEALLRSASIAVIAKTNAARAEDIATVEAEIREANPFAPIVLAASAVTIDDPAAIRGKRVLVVEDGPTITHGGVPYGAGLSAAKTFAAGDVVDPRLSATPEMLAIYARYPHIGPVLPDMGYSDRDLDALRTTIEGASVDAVLVAAPIDLKSLLHLTKPVVRVRYEYGDNGEPRLSDLVVAFLQERGHLRAIA